jgi:hypothetical protein
LIQFRIKCEIMNPTTYGAIPWAEDRSRPRWTLSLEGGRSVIKSAVLWDLTPCELLDGPDVPDEPAAYPRNVGRNCFRNIRITY